MHGTFSESRRQKNMPEDPAANQIEPLDRGASGEQRETYTVPEAARILGLGRNSCYEAVARGEIPSLRVGRRLLIPKAALRRLLSQR